MTPATPSTPPPAETILVTGGSGFFGGVLKRRLLREGFRVVNLDLVRDADQDTAPDPSLRSLQGDIRDIALVDRLFSEQAAAGHPITAVMHCAAQLAHEKINEQELWTSNVDGTRIIAEAARRHGTRSLVFTSSNCLWAENFGRDVLETDEPRPIELYGRSKLQGEKILREICTPETDPARTPAASSETPAPTGQEGLAAIILRCPTIIDSGRLGLLAILFEFIDEGRRVWVVGDGGNRYQFIYAEDLATACLLAIRSGRSDTFNIGSDNVPTLREVYQAVIDSAGTRARVAQLPRRATVAAMQLAHRLGVSPLGPYHYRMIAEDFVFNTTRIRTRLGWRPTLTNQQMMIRAYRFYTERRRELEANAASVSAHSRPAAMGIIRLLKWLS